MMRNQKFHANYMEENTKKELKIFIMLYNVHSHVFETTQKYVLMKIILELLRNETFHIKRLSVLCYKIPYLIKVFELQLKLGK